MMPKYSSAALILAIVGVCSGLNAGFYDCPDDSKAVIQVGDVQKDVPGTIFGVQTLDIRVPESGLLREPITCIIATDISDNGSGGTVALVGGGLNSKYMELKITSDLFKGIKYRIQVYTNAAPTTAKPTTF